jgi:hypothetical protein
MKKKILIGSIIAIAILILISFSSAVGYQTVKNIQEEIIEDEYDGFTPIALVLQLISKLRNHKNINNVETENDVLKIIESDAELNGIIEKLESFDCGCEDETIVIDPFFRPICWTLMFANIIGWFIYLYFHDDTFGTVTWALGEIFNCW